MFLLVTATEFEMASLRAELTSVSDVEFLTAGVGPLETAVTLMHRLADLHPALRGVINVGVGGAYPDTGAELLSICLATREILGDLGVALPEKIVPFNSALTVRTGYGLDSNLRQRAEAVLGEAEVEFLTGTFITVSSVSGSARRGLLLRDAHQAICENMEGAAVARACEVYGIPCLELRCISNMVEDRNRAAWRLQEATVQAARTAVLLVRNLVRNS